VLRGDQTGKVEKVNAALLQILLDNGYAPVISPLSISYESDCINVDGDRAAALIAAQLHADQLIILSNIPGLLKNLDDETSLIRHIRKSEADTMMSYAKRRMKKKVMGAMEAFEGGVRQVIFADARIEKPITEAMQGQGTVIE
jgi:acetylglutamate/LysW-gamma-L-alpha-aminoadipate kinase